MIFAVVVVKIVANGLFKFMEMSFTEFKGNERNCDKHPKIFKKFCKRKIDIYNKKVFIMS